METASGRLRILTQTRSSLISPKNKNAVHLQSVTCHPCAPPRTQVLRGMRYALVFFHLGGVTSRDTLPHTTPHLHASTHPFLKSEHRRAVQPLLGSGPGSLGAGVLGHSLGALGYSMLGQLSRQQQTHSRLDLPGRQCGSARVLGQPGGLAGQPLKQIVHERVHDAHGLGGDADVGVHLGKQQEQSVNRGALPDATSPTPKLGTTKPPHHPLSRGQTGYYCIQVKKKFLPTARYKECCLFFSFFLFLLMHLHIIWYHGCIIVYITIPLFMDI